MEQASFGRWLVACLAGGSRLLTYFISRLLKLVAVCCSQNNFSSKKKFNVYLPWANHSNSRRFLTYKMQTIPWALPDFQGC